MQVGKLTIPARKATRLGWILVLALLLIEGAVRLYRRPPTETTMRSVRSACRLDYSHARTAAESLAVDGRVWQVSRDGRRIPSCGEVRRTAP